MAVPREFQATHLARFWNAIARTEPACHAASALLRRRVADACQGIVESRGASPEARAWLDQYNSRIPEVTPELVESAGAWAGNDYRAAVQTLHAGQVTKDLPPRFLTCALILECVENPECEELKKRAKFAAVNVAQLLQKAVNVAPAHRANMIPFAPSSNASHWISTARLNTNQIAGNRAIANLSECAEQG
jgi:hypothetical protein